ncbi:MAG: SusD/RagB family nutrient-binding outer membrane lipoprotein, partial [Ginsengibacter sp.]
DTFRLRRLYSPGGTDLVPGVSTALDNTIFPVSAYVGNKLGSGASGLGGSGASSVGEGLLKSVGQSQILLSASESYFLQAEAALRGWTGFTGAETDFYNGVLASFTYLESNNPKGNAAAEATALTSQPADKMSNYGACTTDAERLACIIRQKWVAMNGITPFEAYCDYRRLGLPADIPISISIYVDTPPTIPVRFLYPTNEYTLNTANVNAQGAVTGHTSNIFWDK